MSENRFQKIVPREVELQQQNDKETLKQQQRNRHAEIAEQERQAVITRQNIVDAAKYK